MSIIDLLESIPLPPMVRVRQLFDDTRLADPAGELRLKLERSSSLLGVKGRVAVCVGSRGVADIADLTRTVVEFLKRRGAEPFVVPTMGSHGGATAHGQQEVLAHLGVTEAYVGAPVVSSMEVVKLGEVDNGLPVYVDRNVASADGIVIVNRVKPHTAFRGIVESGLMKMISIGLGKQRGADSCHQLGFGVMADSIVSMSRLILSRLPILCGVATIENAFDRICRIEVVPANEIEQREPDLLKEASSRMARLVWPEIDVLVIDRIGKNISGDGMDPNVTGRYPTPFAYGGPKVNKMCVLDVTPESEGNANGVGTADFTTRRLVRKIDYDAMYTNGLTSTVVAPTKIPMTLPNDRLAIQAAVKTCNILDYCRCRLVRIPDTLHLGEVTISEPLWATMEDRHSCEFVSGPFGMEFDEKGNLFS